MDTDNLLRSTSEPSRPRVVILSWMLLFTALANLPFAAECFTRRPPALWAGLATLAQSLPMALGAVLVRKVAPRRVFAVTAGAVALAMAAVIAMVVVGEDPTQGLSLLAIAPLYCAMLFADLRWATAAVSLMSLAGVPLALALGGAAADAYAQCLLPTAVNAAMAFYGARRYRRLLVINHHEAQARLVRLIETYSACAEQFLRLRDEDEVVAYATATLGEGGLPAAFLRYQAPRLELVRFNLGGRPPDPALAAPGLAEQLLSATTPVLVEHLLGQRVFRRDDAWALGFRALPRPVAATLEHLGRGAFAVPVYVEREPYGLLCALGDDLDPANIAAVELFARQLGAAIDNVRQHRRLAERLDEVTRLQRELVHRERLAALGEAAAVVSHEVRNPLAAILNAVDLLRREARLSDRGRSVLGMVQEESMRLDALVRDLLLLARPLSPKLRPLDLRPRVQHAVTVASQGATGRRVRFEVVVALPEAPLASADPDFLQVALVNLLQNAAQASPVGGRVTVSIAPDTCGVLLAVEDEGPGIPEDQAERIFEPFFTTRGEGTGLGLAIVKEIMASHQGAVRVGRAAKGGARFELVLPAARVAAEPAGEPKTSLAPDATRAAGLRLS
ncbi:MAG TPA: ATP-binding protein [Myxococcales bacterium]